jgi:hypothetical protein
MQGEGGAKADFAPPRRAGAAAEGDAKAGGQRAFGLQNGSRDGLLERPFKGLRKQYVTAARDAAAVWGWGWGWVAVGVGLGLGL